jgi:hypothetical protein
MSVETRFRLRRDVRAAITGDLLVLLDLGRNCYWALPVSSDRCAMQTELDRRGLSAGDVAHEVGHAWSLDRHLPEPLALARALIWARGIIAGKALNRAFADIAAAKLEWRACRSPSGQVRVGARGLRSHLESFDALRVWAPASYVCLFDGLALTRFLIGRGHRADLVFGVRAPPFAAHCWVEVEGARIDSGEEDCLSFTEIARV